MPKQKTHKGLKKRVKITAKGKVKRGKSFGSHLMSTKDAKRRRRISGSALVDGAKAAKIKIMLGEA